MALPTSYATENEFALWMHKVLGRAKHVAEYLEWDAPTVDSVGEYEDAVNEALAVYGQSDITAVTDIHLLHKIGRVELWRLVAERTVAEHDEIVREVRAERKFSQIHKHALQMVEMFEKQLPAAYRKSSPRTPFSSTSARSQVKFG